MKIAKKPIKYSPLTSNKLSRKFQIVYFSTIFHYNVIEIFNNFLVELTPRSIDNFSQIQKKIFSVRWKIAPVNSVRLS